MYDKEFQNFLINLDKEKSHSEKMRVNQAYGIYHDIVESNNGYCFIIYDEDTVKIVSDMTPSNAIDFIKVMCKCSSNELFKGQLLMLACSLIKENCNNVDDSFKKKFVEELFNVISEFSNDDKLSDIIADKISSISKSKLNHIINLLTILLMTKEVEGKGD